MTSAHMTGYKMICHISRTLEYDMEHNVERQNNDLKFSRVPHIKHGMENESAGGKSQ